MEDEIGAEVEQVLEEIPQAKDMANWFRDDRQPVVHFLAH